MLPIVQSFGVKSCLEFVKIFNQGIVGCTPTNVPRHGKSLSPISRGYLWVSYPQESHPRTPDGPLGPMGILEWEWYGNGGPEVLLWGVGISLDKTRIRVSF